MGDEKLSQKKVEKHRRERTLVAAGKADGRELIIPTAENQLCH